MARISCALALACLAWFAPGAAAAGRADQGLQQRARAAYSADDIVVHARSGATAAQLRDALTGRGLSLGERIPHTRLFVVRTNGWSVSAAIHSLAGASAVATATPDYVRRALDTPNDPYFASDEPYFATIRTPEAWDLSHGSRGVTIAVVDTGVTRVEDLAGQPDGAADG